MTQKRKVIGVGDIFFLEKIKFSNHFSQNVALDVFTHKFLHKNYNSELIVAFNIYPSKFAQWHMVFLKNVDLNWFQHNKNNVTTIYCVDYTFLYIFHILNIVI